MLEKERKYAIIVAGGTGKRMEAGAPKQFLIIASKPMVMHAMEAFYKYDQETRLILVLPRHLYTQTPDHPITRTPENFPSWFALCKQYDFHIPHEVVPGGNERFHSVSHGLEMLKGEGLIAIHDAARPAISQDLISRSFQIAGIHGAAVPVIPVQETIRKIHRDKSTAIDRKDLFLVQTPQTFTLPLIQKAYRQPYIPSFTDDAAVAEAMGINVHYFEGEKTNIKVTFPEDLKMAEKYMRS